jgi:hypothetical protein
LVLFLICLMILKFLVPFSIALNYLMIVISIKKGYWSIK